MKNRQNSYNLRSGQHYIKVLAFLILFLVLINVEHSNARNSGSSDSLVTLPATAVKDPELFGATITNTGYGGIIFKFSGFNDQFAFMTGGRGACTINKRYTIGGGGYGIANSIPLNAASEDTLRNFKMGYGGLELGYIIIPGKKVNIGGSVLIAAGAAFWQNKPKSSNEKLFDDDFSIFPVLEPSFYGELPLNSFMWLHAGISYRYVFHPDLGYISDQKIRGFSCYIGLLFGKTGRKTS
jgi:hypothetical protein